ncbi:MAG: ABC transporter permease [Acetobacteraceae bacterium]|nr:ABC transporter permease [Acetobacteraceae bacterium]
MTGRRIPALVLGLPRRSPAAAIGLLIVLGFVVAALARPLVWPFGPGAADASSELIGPSLRHPLGTDETGRDMLARVIDGARYAIAVPLAALVLGIALGTPFGLLAGLAGGLADRLLRRLAQAIGFIPPLLLALALVAAMGPSLRHVVLALGVLEAMFFARAMRDQVRAMHDSGFIEAAVAMGNRRRRLILVHLLPNTLAGIASEMPRRAAWALATLAVMGFAGIGTAAGASEWGAMVREGTNAMFTGQWWLALFPGLALLLLGFGLQLLAAGIADLTLRSPASRAGDLAGATR